MPKPRYNHAFDIAFTVETDHKGDEVTAQELWAGLLARIAALMAQEISPQRLDGQPPEIIEACGLPYDTYENEPTE